MIYLTGIDVDALVYGVSGLETMPNIAWRQNQYAKNWLTRFPNIELTTYRKPFYF